MPKSRARKRPRKAGSKSIQWGGAPTTSGRTLNRIIIPVIAAVLLLGGGTYVWQTGSTARAFSVLAEQGEPALARVVTEPDDGRRHLDPGEQHRYPSRYPTSGDHEPVWVRAGFYDEAQPPTRLVHALEHGNVVIYYGDQSAEVIDQLQSWASLYGGQWDGVVVTRDERLGRGIVLTAWRRRLDLDRFDPAAAAAFVEAYRGRGPENPVR